MAILVLRHEPFEHLGRFASILSARNVPYFYRDLGQPLSLQQQRQDGVIIMGGPMSANDPLPGLAAELALIEQAMKARIPLLGICLGAQLIAKALGARVYRNAEEEIGWEPVYLTEAGQADPLFQGIPSPSDFFHWHGETFEMPAGARWLAYSRKCRHQAFSFAESAYGIQFHPEITSAMIVDWCAQPANCGDVEALDRPLDPHAFDPGPWAEQILDRWLVLTRTGMPAGTTR